MPAIGLIGGKFTSTNRSNPLLEILSHLSHSLHSLAFAFPRAFASIRGDVDADRAVAVMPSAAFRLFYVALRRFWRASASEGSQEAWQIQGLVEALRLSAGEALRVPLPCGVTA